MLGVWAFKNLLYGCDIFFNVQRCPFLSCCFPSFSCWARRESFSWFFTLLIYMRNGIMIKILFFFQCLGLHTFCVDSLIGSPLVKSTTALLLLCSAPRFLSCDVRSRSVHIDSEGLTTSQVFSLLWTAQLS